MAFRKRDRSGQEGKEIDRESKRVFHGTNFPPSPRARSSSVGLLEKDRDKGIPDEDEYFLMLGTPPAEKVQDRALRRYSV